MITRLLPPGDQDKVAIRKALERHAREKEIKEKWIAQLRMNYVLDRNFTTVVIRDDKIIYTGSAKRNPLDTYDARIGINIAITRAILSPPFKID